jgi:hypothetical protein
MASIYRRCCEGLLLASMLCAPAAAGAQTPDLHPLVEALRQQGCAGSAQYHTVAGVLCSNAGTPSQADPDAVLKTIGASTQQQIAALSLQTRREDVACALGAPAVVAAGTSVGPTNTDQLVRGLVKSAVESAVTVNPAALVLSIPGLTQVQYEYKGLANGPELRTFNITGHVDGDVDHGKLQLQMDGDVAGDKSLYVQYTVNLQTTKSPFPAWSPFLSAPGDVQMAIVRQDLDTFSPTATFDEKGQHRNGVQAWQDYEYMWHAEKVGARPDDTVKTSGGGITALAPSPYGGDWVGSGWGTETRFVQTRQAFVAQFSPVAASTMTPSQGSRGVIMSLNVKHQTVFYFHVDFDGTVTGHGFVVYTLDPNLCGVATLTRQVNEQVNFLKYLPVVLAVGQQLAEYAVSRFTAAWGTESTAITQKIDEFIETLPPKIEPAAGSREVDQFLAEHPEVVAKKMRNIAFADVDVQGYPGTRLWRSSGPEDFADIPGWVPVPTETSFKTAKWAQEFRFDKSDWDATPLNKAPYDRASDSERMIMEYLAKTLPADASGTVRIYSRYPVCPSCTGVIEQFYWKFRNVTLLVTSGPR